MQVQTGFRPIDEQHQKLFDIMNRLDDMAKRQEQYSDHVELLIKLSDYFIEHFSTEEQYMLNSSYPGYDEQKSQHDGFVQKVKEMNADVRSGKGRIEQDALVFLKDWFVNHIMKLDKQLATFLIERGVSQDIDDL
jgi:hemerythrin